MTVPPDDWTDVPAAGFWPKWLGGVIIPLAFIGYGIVCLVTRRGVLPSRAPWLTLEGAQAAALGIACLAAGAFLHCHYFWGNVYHLSGLATLGKIVAAIAFIAACGYLIIQIAVLG